MERSAGPVDDALRTLAGEGAAFTYASRIAMDRFEPRQVEKKSPCNAACATGSDVRRWIGVIAQRRRLQLTDAEAYASAWATLASTNPFPATLGRICPHPCESACTRGPVDGGVAINAIERFLGDWALRHGLPLPTLERRAQPESVGVVGAGPAGLSFAYQMARRGYRVTIYEKQARPGGMLTGCIPRFRLPSDVVDAEIRRVLALGIDLRLGTAIGRDVSCDELRRRHPVVFVGIGAARDTHLDIPGERGEGVWPGVEYLAAMKSGATLALGRRVVVIGGGNTAVDAARTARRAGASVTVLYRRTLPDMPAGAPEVAAALSEGVAIRCLASPVRIERSDGIVTGVVAQRMQPEGVRTAERRPCRPLANSEFAIAADAVIVAISQVADWSDIAGLRPPGHPKSWRGTESGGACLAVGGDVLGPDTAGTAIAHGRRAAEYAHAKLRSPSKGTGVASAPMPSVVVKTDDYPSLRRARMDLRPVSERFADPERESEQTLGEQAVLDEVTRCYSCGRCFGCDRCFMYCNAGAFSRREGSEPGSYFALDLDRCEGCGKCVELCPCGFLSFA